MWAFVAKFFVTLVVAYVVGRALTPKIASQKPAALQDWSIPQTDEGTPVAVAFGTVRQTGWVLLGYGNYRTATVKSGSYQTVPVAPSTGGSSGGGNSGGGSTGGGGGGGGNDGWVEVMPL